MSQPFLICCGGDVGKALNETRRGCGLTQMELAEQMGLDQAYLARLERGHSVLLLDRVVLALRALGADIVVNVPDPVK